MLWAMSGLNMTWDSVGSRAERPREGFVVPEESHCISERSTLETISDGSILEFKDRLKNSDSEMMLLKPIGVVVYRRPFVLIINSLYPLLQGRSRPTCSDSSESDESLDIQKRNGRCKYIILMSALNDECEGGKRTLVETKDFSWMLLIIIIRLDGRSHKIDSALHR